MGKLIVHKTNMPGRKPEAGLIPAMMSIWPFKCGNRR
jgi:hypothetical protein